jgi:hypothetical protein
LGLITFITKELNGGAIVGTGSIDFEEEGGQGRFHGNVA